MSDWRRDDARRRGKPPTEPPDEPPHRLLRQFQLFHAANPQVYTLFKRFTLRAIERGFTHLSADMVLHRIRWETAIETTDPSFKINNNYAAFYGRMLMRDYPQYNGFFRTRTAAADAGPLPDTE